MTATFARCPGGRIPRHRSSLEIFGLCAQRLRHCRRCGALVVAVAVTLAILKAMTPDAVAQPRLIFSVAGASDELE